MSKRSNAKRGEAHVRLYRHELNCPAYRSLNPAARALLVEMRDLYNGRDNRIHMSVREAMKRLSVSQRPAQHALRDLLDRGFIRLIEPGGFTRKTRHATVYALTSEPLESRDGAVAPKDYLRWQPPPQKNTVADATANSSGNNYRDSARDPEKPAHGSGNDSRQTQKRPSLDSGIRYTGRLPGGVAASGPAAEGICRARTSTDVPS